LDYPLKNGIPLIIWIGENEVKDGIVKVKSLSKKEEYIIKRDELLEAIIPIIKDNPVLLTQE
jgi:histidyl-tRNA synthetase